MSVSPSVIVEQLEDNFNVVVTSLTDSEYDDKSVRIGDTKDRHQALVFSIDRELEKDDITFLGRLTRDSNWEWEIEEDRQEYSEVVVYREGHPEKASSWEDLPGEWSY